MKTTRRYRRELERAISNTQAGFSADKRRRRRQHRKAAKALIAGGTLFNGSAPRGSIPWGVAQWHLSMARVWKR